MIGLDCTYHSDHKVIYTFSDEDWEVVDGKYQCRLPRGDRFGHGFILSVYRRRENGYDELMLGIELVTERDHIVLGGDRPFTGKAVIIY